MSPKRYPVFSGRKLIRRLEKAGYRQFNQKGSHVKLERSYIDCRHIIVVPLHREIDRGTLQSIIRRLKVHLTPDEIDDLLGGRK